MNYFGQAMAIFIVACLVGVGIAWAHELLAPWVARKKRERKKKGGE